MKKVILVLCLIGSYAGANSGMKAPAIADTLKQAAVAAQPVAFEPLEKTLRQLTIKYILVRVALGATCPASPEALLKAGDRLETAYAKGLATVDPREFTLETWKKLSESDCVQDCSCYAISRLYEKYPEDLRRQISNAAIEAKLARMTDREYESCRKKIKNFCGQPEVQSFK